MQLGGSSLRARLGTAACVLLASGAAAAARPAAAATQVDASMLFYGERDRTRVNEPALRVTHLFASGQSLSAQFEFDTMSGASPTGALPTGQVQTTTGASGQNQQTISAGQFPVSTFTDARHALDVEWKCPLVLGLTASTGGHFSLEKDYRSLGGSGTLAWSLFHQRLTLTGGAGYDDDHVFPAGGTPVGFSTVAQPPPTPPPGDDLRFASVPVQAPPPNALYDLVRSRGDPKQVRSAMLGVSQIVTRRWMLGVDAARTEEHGYLTEPYKVVSVVDPATGYTVGQLTEKRPQARTRRDVLGSSVNHLAHDIVYSSYRYYWDDWGVRSHTFDLKLRHELRDQAFFEPHVRYYRQTPADFFRFGLVEGEPLPAFATSDFRLGPLRSGTLGATYGFRLPGSPGEWSLRAEYIRQWGDGHPAGAIGAQRELDLFPAVDIAAFLIGYTREW